jgi:hypothetical protein
MSFSPHRGEKKKNQDTQYLLMNPRKKQEGKTSESAQRKSNPDVTSCALDVGGLPIIAHIASSLAGHDVSILDQAGRAIFFANPNPLTHRWPMRWATAIRSCVSPTTRQ